ncbi:hypothetical protein ES703_61425 [subsurface metagenome]
MNFRMQIKWLPHPSDTKDEEATLEAETIDELMPKFADFLKENIFAEWGYYHNIYYPDIRVTVSYLGHRRTIGVH